MQAQPQPYVAPVAQSYPFKRVLAIALVVGVMGAWYVSGRPLYDGMFTEYGPFYYAVVDGLLSEHAAWTLGGFLTIAAITLAVARAHGVSWGGLLAGMIRNPQRFSGSIGNVNPTPLPLSALALTADWMLLWFVERHGESYGGIGAGLASV
jgi:hypothetical protein